MDTNYFENVNKEKYGKEVYIVGDVAYIFLCFYVSDTGTLQIMLQDFERGIVKMFIMKDSLELRFV